jgi:4-hydroxyacetophenone monooxygenase
MAIGPEVKRAPLHAPKHFHVVIIGAGVSGVMAGIRLKQMGFDAFTILEQNPSPGGTWWQNS